MITDIWKRKEVLIGLFVVDYFWSEEQLLALFLM